MNLWFSGGKSLKEKEKEREKGKGKENESEKGVQGKGGKGEKWCDEQRFEQRSQSLYVLLFHGFYLFFFFLLLI